MTIQITPDVELDLEDTFTVGEDQTIMLADLVNTRTFGPGDQMVLDGLPVGTIVSLPMVGDPINGDETLSYTASGTAPVTIPTGGCYRGGLMTSRSACQRTFPVRLT